MKRFDRLEFDVPGPGEPGSTGPERPPEDGDRDEHHWLKRAEAERREGFFENALRYYSRALELNRSLVEGWIGQVQMLVALGEYHEAELWSRKALELFRGNGDLVAGQAHATARLGDLKKALPISDASFRQEGQSPYRWIVRGEIMVATGQDVDQHCFDKAVQLNSDWLVLVEIGQIYRYRKKPAKGIVRLRQAVERAPDSAYCWYVLGRCEEETGLASAARKSYARAIELKPNYLEVRRRLDTMDGEDFSLTSRIKRLFKKKIF